MGIQYSEKIQKFLYQNGVLVDSKSLDTNKLLENNEVDVNVRFVEKDGVYPVKMTIKVLEFKIYEERCDIAYEDTRWSKTLVKDLSDAWIDYELKNDPENYMIYKVQKLNNQKKQEIKDKYDALRKPLQAKLDDLNRRESQELNKLYKIDDLIEESLLERESKGR